MRRGQPHYVRIGNLARQHFTVTGPRHSDVFVAADHQSWNLDLAQQSGVVHVADGRAASGITSGIGAEESTPQRIDARVRAGNRLAGERALQEKVGELVHAVGEYGLTARVPVGG